MNQTQIKYARERAFKIYNQKSKEITEKHTTKAKTLSVDEKLDALLAGAFKVNRERAKASHTWHFAVDFGETFNTIDTESRDKELSKLTAFYTSLMDELILGDDAAAFSMLKELESFE